MYLNFMFLGPSLTNYQLGVTSAEKKTTGREGIFIFLRNTFKYHANAVLMSNTDIKLIFVFLETKPEINHFWAFVEMNILFFHMKCCMHRPII